MQSHRVFYHHVETPYVFIGFSMIMFKTLYIHRVFDHHAQKHKVQSSNAAASSLSPRKAPLGITNVDDNGGGKPESYTIGSDVCSDSQHVGHHDGQYDGHLASLSLRRALRRAFYFAVITSRDASSRRSIIRPDDSELVMTRNDSEAKCPSQCPS